MKYFISFGLFLTILPIMNIAAQTKQDSLAIAQACRDYVEGWATGNVDRVSKAVSPELVKRMVAEDETGFSYTIDMSASQLKMAAKMNKEKGIPPMLKDLEPGKPFNLAVQILDIAGNCALAKATNAKYGFFDYCQLAKFNGEWKIFNVLWGWSPK